MGPRSVRLRSATRRVNSMISKKKTVSKPTPPFCDHDNKTWGWAMLQQWIYIGDGTTESFIVRACEECKKKNYVECEKCGEGFTHSGITFHDCQHECEI
jgi:hypothetical protein